MKTLERTYEEHAPAIRAYARRRVEPDAVDDIVAETFAIASRKMPEDADPLPWLYAVARKVVHGHRRAFARRGALAEKVARSDSHGSVSGDPAEQVVTDRQLADAFATLTENEREAIRLFVLEGLDGKAAARAAGCSPGAFAVRLSRARKRLRAALPAGVAAVVLVAVLALAPGDGGGGSVIERAAQASAPAESSIVVVTSEVDVKSTGTLHQRKTTWVRSDARGRPIDVRSLITDASGGTSRPGVEDVTTTTPGGRVLEQFDPVTGEVTTTRGGWQEPSLVFRAHELLKSAERGDRVARLDGEETFAGRRVYRVIVTGVQEPALHGDRDVLLIDKETFAPLALRSHSEGTDVHGDPFTYDATERVVELKTLPDNEKNRGLLRMHGPTR